MGGASASTTVEKAAKASKPAAAPVGGVQRGRDNEGFRHPPAPSAAATAARTAKGTGRRPPAQPSRKTACPSRPRPRAAAAIPSSGSGEARRTRRPSPKATAQSARAKIRGQKPNETISRRDSRSTTDGELRTYRKKPQSRAAVSAKKTARAVLTPGF